MNNFGLRVLCCCAFATFVSACAGSGGTPSSGAAPGSGVGRQASPFQIPDESKLANLSGQYAGSVKDSLHGSGHIKASLAQYKTAVGGSLTVSDETSTTTTAVTWTISNGSDLTGSGVAMVLNAACVYTTGSKYDATTHRLTGSYRAVHGCSGQNGTYTMKHQCYYARDWAIVKDSGLKQC